MGEREAENRELSVEAELNKLTSTYYPGATSKSTSCSTQISNRLAYARQDRPELYRKEAERDP